ncbi:MAG: rhombosortase [Opitutaceae bacterium]
MKIRLPFITLTLAAAAIAIHLVPGLPGHLEFDRVAIGHGEIWRWLTGHLTHFESNHLTWDLGVLLLLGSTAERESHRRFVRTVLWSAAAISAAVWWWQPHLQHYRGLSGVDSALFGLVAGALLRRGNVFNAFVGTAALLGIGGKSVFEIATGATVFAAGTAYVPVPLAHLIGLAVGLLMAFTPERDSASKGATAREELPSSKLGSGAWTGYGTQSDEGTLRAGARWINRQRPSRTSVGASRIVDLGARFRDRTSAAAAGSGPRATPP